MSKRNERNNAPSDSGAVEIPPAQDDGATAEQEQDHGRDGHATSSTSPSGAATQAVGADTSSAPAAPPPSSSAFAAAGGSAGPAPLALPSDAELAAKRAAMLESESAARRAERARLELELDHLEKDIIAIEAQRSRGDALRAPLEAKIEEKRTTIIRLTREEGELREKFETTWREEISPALGRLGRVQSEVKGIKAQIAEIDRAEAG